MRRTTLAVLICWGILTCPLAAQTPLHRFEYTQVHMGVQARIVLYAADSALARSAALAAYDRVAELDQIMSDYRATSELMQLVERAGEGPVPVSSELFFVLQKAQKLSELSDGAFDITIGPYVALWREARRSGTLPPQSEHAAAGKLVGWQHITLDEETRTVRLARPGVRLDLGGIAKGYAADEAIRCLREAGVDRALVEMGGDIVVSGPPPDQDGWNVTVPNAPREMRKLVLVHGAVSTSGDTEQFVEIGGRRYSHVVDPRTGLGLTNRIAVSVVAPQGITADALSTTLSILGPVAGAALVDTHFPEVEAAYRYIED